ncbi:FeoB-associated Cys-rich membrane protein [Anaerotardibacter muris]|uniref:FeoB-associated Cys-rich membrane protein n=1 Tax=Anaerotardibacter muris TaxID=2941505 RepID=UPI00203D95B3|nr:FeoB-associated Cys-rich membrane protein [Anaerotardibacter muris]
MNLGTAVVSLLLVVVVVAIILGIVKDKRAGKNVGCGSCKSCAHTSSSQKTSHANSSCCSCSSLDKMLADMEQAAGSSPDVPPSKSSH